MAAQTVEPIFPLPLEHEPIPAFMKALSSY